MRDRAAKIPPGDATRTPRAGQGTGNGHPHKEYRPQGSARKWTPSGARPRPPAGKASIATLFDRLGEAAAVHDGDAVAEIFGTSA